ncbi:VOC family protein [Novosphingobium aerophilum]|uniref:Glyoxalase n=1 Tax=Novosphingobium pentaromativorans TaxID=205844 RepID=A0A2W5NJS6_9SPHN|nr:VOC family protein [Novosphingobium sp. TCA1]PZQ53701.1 MAG: glyoxalase [Novosphingobium pentaromativorans]GFE75769.1 lactoylglutathione lyase [Novosphingobium sp. TCA1]
MGIFTHACLGTNDLGRAACFYDAALLPLGIANLGPFQEQGLCYGRTVPELLILHPLEGRATSSNGATLGFKAPSRLAVDQFHAAGLAAGGTDAGGPGQRNAVPHAYGAYLLDPDGNKICAYCFDPC